MGIKYFHRVLVEGNNPFDGKEFANYLRVYYDKLGGSIIQYGIWEHLTEWRFYGGMDYTADECEELLKHNRIVDTKQKKAYSCEEVILDKLWYKEDTSYVNVDRETYFNNITACRTYVYRFIGAYDPFATITFDPDTNIAIPWNAGEDASPYGISEYVKNHEDWVLNESQNLDIARVTTMSISQYDFLEYSINIKYQDPFLDNVTICPIFLTKNEV